MENPVIQDNQINRHQYGMDIRIIGTLDNDMFEKIISFIRSTKNTFGINLKWTVYLD
jgi:hypothetical protein